MSDIASTDLRQVLDLLRAKGELAQVTGEVHWDRELGAVTREVLRRKGPALLFDNITGYNGPHARGRQVATSLLASHRRISLILGFEDAVDNGTLVAHVRRKNTELLAPTLVDDGPVHENVILGEDIDLTDFPIPHWHHLDGGRYINTFGAVITKDPETGSVNAGVYRGMISRAAPSRRTCASTT
jgi:UbiD family decarboxylase